MSINSRDDIVKDYYNIVGKDKKRVVFYARVSTDNEDQLHSLDAQRDYFSKFIQNNPEWEFVGMYVDEGITGTSVKKRKEFKRMIQEAKEGKFDLILTKEVSRFARNTVDTLYYTRELSKNNVYVFFTIDNINTEDKDGELRLTIMASLAQEESRKLSERVKWGQEKSMQNGIVFGNNLIFGFIKKNGTLTPNPDTAWVIQLIFNLYDEENKGLRAIKSELERREIKTATGKYEWDVKTIAVILRNEKYAAILNQRKYPTDHYLEKNRMNNNHQQFCEWIFAEAKWEPIISKEQFFRVQEKINLNGEIAKENKTRRSTKTVYSGKIICRKCGKNFKRVVWDRHKDKLTETNLRYGWYCINYANNGKKKIINGETVGCNSKGIPEHVLDEIMKFIIQKLWTNTEKTISCIEASLEKIIKDTDFSKDISEINSIIKKYQNKINLLIELYTDGGITKEEFSSKREPFIQTIEEQKKLLNSYSERQNYLSNKMERINKIKEMFNVEIDFSQPKLPDEIVGTILNKIVIFDKKHFKIYLNNESGYTANYIDKNLIILPFVNCIGKRIPQDMYSELILDIIYLGIKIEVYILI